MKILVTGAKGFVGKNLVAALNNVKDGKDRTRPALSIDEIFEYDIDTKIVLANAGGLRKWPLSYGSFAMRSISYQSLPPSIPHKEQISDCEEAFSMQRQVCSWHDGCPLSPDYISHHFKLLLEKINCRIFVFTICGIRREVYYWKMGLISRLYRNF